MTARVLGLLLLIALPAFAQAPADWDDVRNRADDLAIAQKDTEAIAVLSGNAKTQPRFADVHVRLGDLHERLASRLAYDPKSAAVRTQHMLVAEARTLADEAIALAPRDREVFFSKARVLRLQATRVERQPAAVKKLSAEADRLEKQAFMLIDKR